MLSAALTSESAFPRLLERWRLAALTAEDGHETREPRRDHGGSPPTLDGKDGRDPRRDHVPSVDEFPSSIGIDMALCRPTGGFYQ